MEDKNIHVGPAAELRRQAEDIYLKKTPLLPENPAGLPPEELKRILHELGVHQIELEMQNEELRRAQHELDAQRARYFDLYDLAPVGYLTVSAKGLIVQGNLTAAALLDEPRSTLTGRPFSKFIQKEDQDVYYLRLKQLFGAGEPQACELRLVKKDGTAFWAHLEAALAKDAAGADEARLTISDLTEHKRADSYLEISEEILQMLNKPLNLEDSVKSIVTTMKTRGGFDAVGMRLKKGEDYPYFFEQGFPADFLRTENTLVERGADGGLCRDKDGKVCLECTCGLVISGRPAPVLTKGGSFWTNDSFPLVDLPPAQDPRLHPRNNCIHKKYASVALVPIRGKTGIVGLLQLNSHKKDYFSTGIIAQLETMTAYIGEALMRKRAEEEREEMQLQLHQSQKMESVGRLAGGVAHDFNNLLTAIIGYGGFLLKELAGDDSKRNDVKEILNAAERAAGLTRQLLAFSRKQILNPVIIDLNSSVTGTVKLLARLIGEEVKIEIKLANRPCQVKVDAGQIDQVLVNLAVNARDAMPKGGKLTLETELLFPKADFFERRPELARGPLVCLSVRDTGLGMTEEVKKHMFEPFFTSKEKGKGTGLGISTVFGIVKQSGGEIEIDSELNVGTTCRIYLPHIENAVPDKDKEKETLLSGSETILLVEDEESLLRLGERVLRINGYTVIAAADGKSALEAAARHGKPVDLLLTDVVLPGMNGRELSAELARRKLVCRTLFMSGYTEDAIIEHGVLASGIAFIYKPFTAEALSQKLREVLDGPAGKAKA